MHDLNVVSLFVLIVCYTSVKSSTVSHCLCSLFFLLYRLHTTNLCRAEVGKLKAEELLAVLTSVYLDCVGALVNNRGNILLWIIVTSVITFITPIKCCYTCSHTANRMHGSEETRTYGSKGQKELRKDEQMKN